MTLWDDIKYYFIQGGLLAAMGAIILPLVLLGIALLLLLSIMVVSLWKFLVVLILI